jgi:hypothetical protein
MGKQIALETGRVAVTGTPPVLYSMHAEGVKEFFRGTGQIGLGTLLARSPSAPLRPRDFQRPLLRPFGTGSRSGRPINPRPHGDCAIESGRVSKGTMMVVFNTKGLEINAKVVYYGPALSGKTTNLEQIYERMPSDSKGKMVSMKTRTDRTLFFDFLPLELGDINGYRTRMLLYTVPGQVYYNATRKLVLKGADAVVFVADSAASKLAENIESLRNLEENLNELSLTLDTMPWVIQYNKRDLPDAAPVDTLDSELNLLRVPSFEAIATQGIGVYETFHGIARLLYAGMADRLSAPEQAATRAPQPAVTVAEHSALQTGGDPSVSRVIDLGLREVGEKKAATPVTGTPRTPSRETSQPVGAAGAQQRSPAAVCSEGRRAPANQEEAEDRAFRFVSLEVAPLDENVGRVIDLEQRNGNDADHPDRGMSKGLFLTDPLRSEEQPAHESDDLSKSISKMESVTLQEQSPPAQDECVITVPVLLTRSQAQKTIPIKLHLEVQVIDD